MCVTRCTSLQVFDQMPTGNEIEIVDVRMRASEQQTVR